MTSRRLMSALPVVVAVILPFAVAWSLLVVSQTRLGADATAALRAQGQPDGQVVTFTAGRIDPGQADIRPNEAAYVGSVSKTFTAAMTLRLVDRGVLRIDDPVVTHLPALPRAGPAGGDGGDHGADAAGADQRDPHLGGHRGSRGA
ncbi:serine hydrolase domain-containing protein [Corynebacterium suedekumii]|nr:serine hydrolase domain-containing protein [Corynebacterium suedekumii]